MAEALSTSLYINEPVGGGTSGAIPFVNTTGKFAQSPTTFSWDDTSKIFKIGDVAAGAPSIYFLNGVTAAMSLYRPGNTSDLAIDSSVRAQIQRWTNTGNIALFDFTNGETFGSGIGVLNWVDAVTAPTANPTLGALLYSSSGNTFHRSSSGLRTQINFNVTPEVYGAKGDGVTNDSVALQAAFNSGSEVFLRAVVYLYSTGLTLPDQAKINGAGKYATVLKYTGIGKAISEASNNIHVQMSDLTVSVTGNNAIAIDVSKFINSTFSSVRVASGAGSNQVGINANITNVAWTSFYNEFIDMTFDGLATGLSINASVNQRANRWRVISPTFLSCGTCCLLTNVQGIQIVAPYFDEYTVTALNIGANADRVMVVGMTDETSQPGAVPFTINPAATKFQLVGMNSFSGALGFGSPPSFGINGTLITDPSEGVFLNSVLSTYQFSNIGTVTDAAAQGDWAAGKVTGGKVVFTQATPQWKYTSSNSGFDVFIDAPAASIPALRWQSAGTTKMSLYRPATTTDLQLDSVTISALMYWTNDGKVGFGNAAPPVRIQLGSSTVSTLNILRFGKYEASTEGFLPIIQQKSVINAGNGNDLALASQSGSGSVVFYTGATAVENVLGGGSSAIRAFIDANGNVVVGTAALATNATNGFLYVAGMAGTPTGVPTTFSGRDPITIDHTNAVFYFYSGGWKAAPSGSGTANQVAYWNAGNTLTSSANLTFNGTTLTVVQYMNIGTATDAAAQGDFAAGKVTGGKVVFTQATPQWKWTSSNSRFDVYLDAPAANAAQLNFQAAGVTKISVYRPASTNDLSLDTATISNLMYWTSDGKVGLANNAPPVRLQIGSSTANTLNIVRFGKYEAATEGFLPIIQQKSVINAGNGNDLALASQSGSGSVVFYTGATAVENVLGGGSSAIRAFIDANGNVVVGTAALATNATNGFLYVEGMAGIPTGTPTSYTGRYPTTWNSTDNVLEVYNSFWRALGGPNAYKTADQTITNSTVLTNDNALSVNVAASRIYQFRIQLFVTSASVTAGIKLALSGTSSVTSLKAQIYIYNSATNVLAAFSRVTAFGTSAGANLGAGDQYCVVEGSIQVNGAGTLLLQWAQNTADAVNGTTVQQNSVLKCVQVG